MLTHTYVPKHIQCEIYAHVNMEQPLVNHSKVTELSINFARFADILQITNLKVRNAENIKFHQPFPHFPFFFG